MIDSNQHQIEAKPRHWKNIDSPVLTKTMKSFLRGESVDAYDRGVLGVYFREWLDHPWEFAASVKEESEAQLAILNQSFKAMVQDGDRTTINQWLDQLLHLGIDPL